MVFRSSVWRLVMRSIQALKCRRSGHCNRYKQAATPPPYRVSGRGRTEILQTVCTTDLGYFRLHCLNSATPLNSIYQRTPTPCAHNNSSYDLLPITFEARHSALAWHKTLCTAIAPEHLDRKQSLPWYPRLYGMSTSSQKLLTTAQE